MKEFKFRGTKNEIHWWGAYGPPPPRLFVLEKYVGLDRVKEVIILKIHESPWDYSTMRIKPPAPGNDELRLPSY